MDILTDIFSKDYSILLTEGDADILIVTSIPIVTIWSLQMNLRQKLILAGIFVLTVIIIIFAIIRVALVSNQTSPSAPVDPTWLYLWTSIEPQVGKWAAVTVHYRN